MRKRLSGILFGVLILFVFNVIVYADIPKQDSIQISENDYGYREVEGLQDATAVNESQYHTYNWKPNKSEFIPSSYKTPNLPEVRDQKPYGTCWAFATVGLGEISIKQQENVTYDLSEHHLAYFSYNTVQDPLGGTAGDNNAVGIVGENYLSLGGNLIYSTQILAAWEGLALEEKFPYSNASQPIPAANAYDSNVAHLQNAFLINLSQNSDIAKKMILKYGAMGVSFYAANTLINPFYNSATNAYYCASSMGTNHAVLVVGWDDNFPKENFTQTPEGNGAWLIRNSWGSDSDSYAGYFWLSYYDKSLSDIGYIYDVVSKDSDRYYDHNYMYDGSMGYEYIYNYNENNITCANVFTSKYDNEELKAVSFATANTQEQYQIKIYKNLKKRADPRSGILVAEMTGTTTCEGMYTIPLAKDDYVTLQKDDTYSVVITLTKEETSPSFLIEWNTDKDDWVKCTAKAEAGQSFILTPGGWLDYGLKQGVNIRIKAYTNDIFVPATAIAINGDCSVMEVGDIKSLSSSIYPSNASNKNVVWSSTDESIVSVDSEGRVTAKNRGIVSIIATSGDGNVRDSYEITVYPKVTGISLNLSNVEMTQGEKSVPLEVTYTPLSINEDKRLYFTSLDSRIAIVENGYIVAKAPGITTIQAICGKCVAECKVTVYPANTKVNAVWNPATQSVALTWNQVFGVDGYYIVRRNSSETICIAYCNGDSVTSYNDTSINGQYIYMVQPYVLAGDTAITSASETMVNYGIAYVTNGGRNNRNPNQYNYKTSGFALTSPLKDGYTFMGWYTDAGYKIKKTTITTSDYGNITLYAKWVKKTYKITYKLSGGVNSKKNLAYYYITTPTFTLAKPKKTGYTFNGWYTSSNFKSNTKVTTIIKGTGKNITLYAKWTANTYNIKFSGNKATSGTVKKATKLVYGKSYSLPTNKYKRKGYVFTGWNTKSNGKGKVYKNKADIKNLTSQNGKTITLYAQWKKKK